MVTLRFSGACAVNARIWLNGNENVRQACGNSGEASGRKRHRKGKTYEDAGGMSENRLCVCCPCGDQKRRGAVDSEVGGSAGISEKPLKLPPMVVYFLICMDVFER